MSQRGSGLVWFLFFFSLSTWALIFMKKEKKLVLQIGWIGNTIFKRLCLCHASVMHPSHYSRQFLSFYLVCLQFCSSSLLLNKTDSYQKHLYPSYDTTEHACKLLMSIVSRLTILYLLSSKRLLPFLTLASCFRIRVWVSLQVIFLGRWISALMLSYQRSCILTNSALGPCFFSPSGCTTKKTIQACSCNSLS